MAEDTVGVGQKTLLAKRRVASPLHARWYFQENRRVNFPKYHPFWWEDYKFQKIINPCPAGFLTLRRVLLRIKLEIDGGHSLPPDFLGLGLHRLQVLGNGWHRRFFRR